MNRVTHLFLLAALLISLLGHEALAVDLKKGNPPESPAEASDLAVSVSLIGEQGGVYRAGREIRFSFSTTSDAYVVVYNIDADGYVHLLWPEDGRLTRTEGNRTTIVPEAGSAAHWETGDRTGIEYIHAVAVSKGERIKEEELSFLARNDELPAAKRFRVDTDPYLAFNMIDEQIVSDAERMPPATDYTYFYINRQVEYPRYLCSQCHAEEKLPDPYAMECTEVVIEKSTYDEEVHYPYPPLYDIRHVGSQARDENASGDEGWVDEEEDTDTDVHLNLNPRSYGWPYYDGYLFAYYPVYWDPFWWDWGWPYYWGGFYIGWHSWWYHPYGYWNWGWGHDWWYCGGYRDGWYGSHRHHPSFGDRPVVKRRLDYRTVNSQLSRERFIAGNRITKDRREPVGSRLERAALGSRSLARSDMNRVAPIVRGAPVGKRTVYGTGARGDSGLERSRLMKRYRSDTGASGSRGSSVPPGMPRTRSDAGRERPGSRGAVERDTRSTRREDAPRVGPRERSGASSGDKQRSGSSGSNDRGVERRRTSSEQSSARSTATWKPQIWQAPVRSVSRSGSAPSSPPKTASPRSSASETKRR